jgi:hypothetical protein
MHGRCTTTGVRVVLINRFSTARSKVCSFGD